MTRTFRDGFQGQLTIDNDTDTAINGWQLTVVLPGDRFQWARPYYFHADGDMLTVFPPSNQQVIAPGASVTEDFMAQGTSTALGSCTLNGAPC